MKNNISKSILALAIGALFADSALACTASPEAAYGAAALRATGGALKEDSSGRGAEASLDSIFNRTAVGLWDVKFYDPTGKIVVDRAYEIFHEDGTEIMTDSAPPASGNVCVGVYKQTGLASYKLKHVSFTFDPAGNVVGSAVFNTTLTVDLKGKTFQGTTTVTVYDINGNVIFQVTGPVKASRITAD